MKWKDLSLKERKQIYDSVRVNNPDATYLDIKQQFDSIPAYQDGKGKTINKEDLPPEYRTGTPEYFERQRKISGAVNTVQPEVNITPAGHIKDAVNFIEDLGKGDYVGAVIDAVLNLAPWGVGGSIKKLKSKYVKWGNTDKDGYGQTNIKNIKDNVMENLYPAYPIPSYKDGGIHIKKKNRGKFTAAAKRAGMGVQAYAKKVLKDPNASPTLKKRANFARNFGGRKKK